MNAICIKPFTFLPPSFLADSFTSTVGIIYTLERSPLYGWQLVKPDCTHPFYGLTTELVVEHFRELI